MTFFRASAAMPSAGEIKIRQAIKRAPRRFAEVIADILRKPPEREMGLPEKRKVRDKNANQTI